MVRLAVPAATVIDVTARTGGELSAVYEVRCAEPSDSVIVKIYADEWRWKQAKEAHVYRLLAEHGAGPAPAILHAEPAGERFGRAFTVMTLLPGEPLSELAPPLDGSQAYAVYRQLGAILAAVHRIRQDAFGYLTTHVLDPLPTNTAYMTRQFDKKLAEFADLGGDEPLGRDIRAYVTDRTELFAHCPTPVLCHNDFYEGNVLVTPGSADLTVTGFVDVENAVAADPLLDLAKTDYYSMHGDPAKLSGLLDGYGAVPDDWPDRLAIYELYHALELWDWFATIGRTDPLPDIARDMRAIVAPPPR